MAGGSQIIINKNGITVITPAKFEVKAGQHKFIGGEKVIPTIPILPFAQSSPLCALKSKFGEEKNIEDNDEK